MIEYEVHVEGDPLHVVPRGEDESLQEMLNYSRHVIEQAREHGVRRVLLDERRLTYRLGTFDTYELARQTAEQTPEAAFVPLMPNPEGIEDAAFWENVVVHRGLTACVFRKVDAARAWLENPT